MDKPEKGSVRVRIAPSPTGYFHIGTARTALFNWLFARHHGGQFIVRVEDTDKERSQPEFEKDILAGLEWLGLRPDEFYRQSERGEHYRKYLEKLLAEGKAFWCYHSKEELETESKEQMAKREAPRHVCNHKVISNKPKVITEGIIRLAVDRAMEKIGWHDLVRGDIEFSADTVSDVSLAKDLDTPLYNFAVVVDDYEMQISHVIRGEDHIANTPKQIAIFHALGIEPPQFVHLPLILGPDRSKLSKRHAAVAFNQYIEAGYTPETIINFLVLLGWTPNDDKQELISTQEAIEQFTLEKIHKSGAIFNPEKLNWISNQHLRQLGDDQLVDLVLPFAQKNFSSAERVLILRLLPMLRERLQYLDQIKEFAYFFKTPEYEADLLIWKKSDAMGAKQALNKVIAKLTSASEWEDIKLRADLDQVATEAFAGDRGAVYWPTRVALSGEKFSADPVQIMLIIGQTETLSRLQVALTKLN